MSDGEIELLEGLKKRETDSVVFQDEHRRHPRNVRGTLVC
jgi:hypothetical protein